MTSPLTFERGRFYRNRQGDKVEILLADYIITSGHDAGTYLYVRRFTADGQHRLSSLLPSGRIDDDDGADSPLDLVAEWHEPMNFWAIALNDDVIAILCKSLERAQELLPEYPHGRIVHFREIREGVPA